MTIKFPELTDVEGKIADRRKKLADIFADAKTADGQLDLSKVKGIDGDTTAKAAEVRKLNDELTDLGKQHDDLKALFIGATNGTIEEHADDPVIGRTRKTWVDQIVDSGVLERKGIAHELDDFQLKAVFTTAAGWAAPVIRNGVVVESAQRQPVGLIDLLPTTTTTAAAITYMEETTFTNAAAETAEGGAKPESTLVLTERTSNVRKIPVILPVTDEQLADVPQVRGYLENRLPFMVRQRLSAQVITGNGTAPNLRGLLNVAGIQTQAKGADPVPDAIYKAMVKVMTGTGQAMPNGVVINPLNWQEVRLLRTVDGIYIWGNPSDAGPERIWGLTVAQDQAITAGTALVADFTMTELAIRQGLTVELGYNADDWAKNQQTFRAEMRVALVAYRPAAICTVTGLP